MKRYEMKDGRIVLVRDAEEKDAAAIQQIVESVASEKCYIVPENSRKDWDRAIREIKARESLIIVASVDGKIVGMAHLVRGKFVKNRHVGFLGISILKEFRGLGIGNALMRYMMEWVEKSNIEKISLTVFSTNKPAIRLYAKFGFQIEGICRKHFKIENEYVDDLIMGKLLKL